MRPNNKYSVYTHRNTFEETLAFDAAETHLWEVDLDAIPTVNFKDIYPDGHNEVDQTARDWLLAMFDYMCPIAVDSSCFSQVNEHEEDAWHRVELATEETCPVEADAVIAVLKETGLDYYGPGDHCGHKWPCVEIRQAHISEDKLLVDLALDEIGWKRGAKQDENTEEITYEVVPQGADEDDTEDEDDGFEDGWHGILLSAVFVVKEKFYTDILNRAGFYVLQHDDTGTVVAQVGYCGMSNEHSRAHAGFLLCADRDWPILTKRGWCRPVA